MPKPQTPDEIRENAERTAREAAEAQAALDELTMQDYRREQEAQAALDQATVAGYDRARLDQAVDDARAELDEAIAAWPVTQALSAYILAAYRRSWAHADFAAARGRLGLEDAGSPPHPAFVEPLHDVVTRAATNAAQAALDAERGNA